MSELPAPKVTRKKPPQTIVGYTKKGHPVFGYNLDGVPICNSSLGTKAGRCQSTILFPNGRCRVHGGPLSSKNPFLDYKMREKLYRSTLPADEGLIFAEAIGDAEYTSLRAELGLSTVQINKLLESLSKGDDLDTESWEEVVKLANLVQDLVFDDVVMACFAMTESKKPRQLQDAIEKLLLRIKRGADKRKIFNEINQVVEFRRKLTETELKREERARTTIAVSDVILLFRNFTSTVVKIFKDDEEGLARFMGEIDKSALNVAMAKQANVLGLKEKPSSLINPTSVLTEEMKEHLAEINDLERDIHYDTVYPERNKERVIDRHEAIRVADQVLAEIEFEDGEDSLLESGETDVFILDPNRKRKNTLTGISPAQVAKVMEEKKVQRKLKF